MKKRHPLLTTDEVAERLSVSPRFVRKLVQRRQLSRIKLGRAIRFDPQLLDREIAVLTEASLTSHRTSKQPSLSEN